ncbi:MAG: folate family ECF transporter S component [Clostridiales bacterium]|nr:folate family ECF transporter S component [Clostridiales bacterium]
MKKILNTKVMVTLALLIAINLILTRIFVIYFSDFSRFDLGNVPLILAGLFFGPAAGAIAGAAADILGSVVLSGRGWFPPLTIGPVLMGLIPGLLRRFLIKKNTLPRVLAIVILTEAVASLAWKAWCLATLYHVDYSIVFIARLPVVILLMAVETALVYILFKRLLKVLRPQ